MSITSRRTFALGLAGCSLVAFSDTAEAKHQHKRWRRRNRRNDADLDNVITNPRGGVSRSGLPWKSGWSLSRLDEFEQWRGRSADTYTIWTRHETWSDIVNFDRGGFAAAKRQPGQISWGFAMLPSSHSAARNGGMWTSAARGAFDGFYTEVAEKLARSGVKDVIMRVGWEANHTFPWFGGSNPAGFVDTFRRISDIMRRHNPTIQIEWNMLKKGKQPGSVIALYPGDSYVDIVGVDYYDNFPKHTEAGWRQQFNATYNGGPWGVGAWLDFAKSRGKKLALPEWGLSLDAKAVDTDNPVFIENMYQFLSANSQHIAYENYFNQKAHHQIMPANLNPKASAAYLRNWGR